MVLLDKVVEIDSESIIVELVVRDDGLFSDSDKTVPAWVGLEYMAQTVAAFSGYHRKCQGEKVDLGFLLGTRFYQCSAASFPCGTQLTVTAKKIIEAANEMSVFNAVIEGENIYAHSQLNLLLPKDSNVFLREKGL
jgi:predicted hotdog family 3-hydroxylacyl-ACP dehydratase